jgi:hypothetical protein
VKIGRLDSEPRTALFKGVFSRRSSWCLGVTSHPVSLA